MVNGDASTLINQIVGFMKTASTALVALAVLVVIYLAVRFALSDSAKRAEWRGRLITGLIALAVIFSIFGLVRLLQATVFGTGELNNTANTQQLNNPSLGL